MKMLELFPAYRGEIALVDVAPGGLTGAPPTRADVITLAHRVRRLFSVVAASVAGPRPVEAAPANISSQVA